MGAGEGKGWAKGKTAGTDRRISKAAATHRGMIYQRHVPFALDRRRRDGSARTLPLEWSPTMAYVVGLIATDGCLISGVRYRSLTGRNGTAGDISCRIQLRLRRKRLIWLDYATRHGKQATGSEIAEETVVYRAS